MTSAAKRHQIRVRLANGVEVWLTRRSGGSKTEADFVRQLIEKARDSEKEMELLLAFNRAAADLTSEDLAERESLLGGFVGASE